MSKISLREASEYDLIKSYAQFMKFHVALEYSDISSYEEVPREAQITTFADYQKLLSETNVFFIVLDNNKVVGYIMLDVYENGVALVQEISIGRKFRRKGFGKKAIKKLIEILSKEDDVNMVKVYSATIGTDVFYNACGFEWIREGTFVYPLRS